jgi:predicted amidohydrolase
MEIMLTEPIRLGMGQLLVECGEPAANLQRAQTMIRSAAHAGCRVVVLPECLDLGWTFPGARQLAQPIPGSTSDLICATAADGGIYVVAGITEKAGDRLYNSAILVSPHGKILLKHRKINEPDIAHDLYSLGTSVGVAETELGRIAINICADNFPDSLALAHAQCEMGCRILLSPCTWAVDADHDNRKEPYGSLWTGAYSSIARQNRIPVVGVSNVGWLTAGPWQGRKCIGCSLAIGADGEVLAQAPYGESAEQLILVEIN